MSDTPTVHQAWSAAMGDLREIRKAEMTTGGSRYNFRGVDTVTNACGPVFRTHGLMVIPKVRSSRHRDFTSGQKNTTMHEAIVTVDYTIYGPAGDSMEGASIGEAADASDKATAQAMSVAYRIFLLQSMTMPTDDTDPDMQHVDRAPIGQPRPAAVAPKPEFTPEQAAGAFADLHSKMATVAEPTFGEMVKWLETTGVTDKSITRALAAEWFDKIKSAPTHDGPVPAPKGANGFRSDADRDQTWESLNERHDLALKSYPANITPTQVDKPAKDSFTKVEGEDWQVAIIALELQAEPF